MITENILQSVQEHHKPIVLSDRKEHLKTLHKMLSEACQCEDAVFEMLEGTLSARQRQQKIDVFTQAAEKKNPACIFATSSLLGEGFDLPMLDTLFLAMPISFKGRLIQYAGRLHRSAPGKSKVIVYDYLDELLPLAASMYRRRLSAYQSMGYVIRY